MTKPIENEYLNDLGVDYSRSALPDKIQVNIDLSIPIANSSYDLKSCVKKLAGISYASGRSLIFGEMRAVHKDHFVFALDPMGKNNRALTFPMQERLPGRFATSSVYPEPLDNLRQPLHRIEIFRISDNRFVEGITQLPSHLSLRLKLSINVQRVIHFYPEILELKGQISDDQIVSFFFHPRGIQSTSNYLPTKINPTQFYKASEHTLTGIMELVSADIAQAFGNEIRSITWQEMISGISLKYIEVAKDLQVKETDSKIVYGQLEKQLQYFHRSSVEIEHMTQGLYSPFGAFERNTTCSCKFFPTKNAETIFYLKSSATTQNHRGETVTLMRLEHRYRSDVASDVADSKAHTCKTIRQLVSLIKKICNACDKNRIYPVINFFREKPALIPKDAYLFVRAVTTNKRHATPEAILEIIDQLAAFGMIRKETLSESAGKLMRNLTNTGVKKPISPFLYEKGCYYINPEYHTTSYIKRNKAK